VRGAATLGELRRWGAACLLAGSLVVLVPLAAAADPLPLYERDVVRIEEGAAENPDAFREEADQLRQELRDRIRTEEAFAATSTDQADRTRLLVDSARRLAEENRARAERYARDARDPLLSDDWRAQLATESEKSLVAAAEDDARAEAREQDAARLRQQAQKHQNEADRLADLIVRIEAAFGAEPEQPETADSGAASEATPADAEGAADVGIADLDVEDVLGMWQPADGPGFQFVIVPQDPDSEAYRYRLEAHTGNRVWKGQFTSFPRGDPGRIQPARMVFTYTPQPREMNPEIPDWATAAIDGHLQWRLEVDETGTISDPRLRIKWYRGEVRWTEGEDARAWIEGDGVPLIFDMEPVTALTVEEFYRPSLAIQLASPPDHDGTTEPIEALMHGQEFRVRVTLPAPMAREQGNTLTVKLKSLESGDEEELELVSGGPAGNRPAVYTNAEAVMVTDCGAFTDLRRNPQLLSWNWIWGLEGSCIDVDVPNGTEFEVSYDHGFQRVVMYDTWVQRGIARHAEAVDRLRAAYFAMLEGGSPEVRDNVARKLQMLVNYETLVENEALTDVHKFALGELYLGRIQGPGRYAVLMTSTHGDPPSSGRLGLMQQSQEHLDWWLRVARASPANLQPDGSWYNPLMQAFLEGVSGRDLDLDAYKEALGVSFASEAEAFFVEKALKATSADYASTAVRESASNYAYGLYTGYVSATPAGDAYMVFSGKDHFGKRVQSWERVTAAVGLASNAVLEVSGAAAARSFNRYPATSSRLGRGAVQEATVVADGVADVRRLDGADVAALDMPSSVSGAQRRSVTPRLDADPPGEGGCACARRAPQAGPRPSVDPLGEGLDLTEMMEVEDYMRRAYPEGTKMLDPTGAPLMATQSPDLPTCNALAAAYIIFKKLQIRLTEAQIAKQARNIMVEQIFETDPQRIARRRGAKQRDPDYLASGPGTSTGDGFDQLSIRDLLRAYGGKVAEVDRFWNGMIKLRHIWSALEKGYMVKLVLKLPEAEFGADAFHAVVVDGLRVARTPNGLQIRGVRVYDSNIGRVVEVPAARFKQLIASDITDYGIMTIVKFDDD